MEVTFKHDGHTAGEPGGGATYQVGEYTVWLDPTNAAYVDVEGLHLECDSFGEKVRIFPDDDNADYIDTRWRDIGELMDQGGAHAVPVLTAMLIHAHITRYRQQHQIAA